jgi:hypothetical protein
MLDARPDFIPLPSDPRELTRDLVLQFCTHPEVLAQEFARLAQSQPNPTPTLALVKAAESHG